MTSTSSSRIFGGLLAVGVVVDVPLQLPERVEDDGLIALVGAREEERLADLPVLRLGDAGPGVADLLRIGAVVVHELAVAADRLRELLLLEVRVRDAELRELRELRVVVLPLHFAEERLRLEPVVGLELLHRLVVRALRVGGVAEGGPRLLLLAADCPRGERRGEDHEGKMPEHRGNAYHGFGQERIASIHGDAPFEATIESSL